MGTVISTSTTNFDKALVTLIQKRLEEELRAPLPHLLPGNFRKAEFVKGTNNTMRFLRIVDMAALAGEAADPAAGTAPWLTEGTPPTSEDLVFGYEEFSANQAGRVIKLTDKAILQNPIDLLATASEKVARNAIETADRRVARVVNAGTNVLYGGNATTRGGVGTGLVAGDTITASLLRRAVANLKTDNVPAFRDGYYRAIINPAVSFDFQEDTGAGGWMEAAKYAGSMPLLTGELGKFAGVRFIEASTATVFALAGDGGADDVYSTFIMGTEAYAFGDWGSIESHITPPGGHDDPLHQSALVGWKGYFGAMLVGEGASATNASGPRYIRLETTSDL
jgi:N4-gp56 family major capsid protein